MSNASVETREFKRYGKTFTVTNGEITADQVATLEAAGVDHSGMDKFAASDAIRALPKRVRSTEKADRASSSARKPSKTQVSKLTKAGIEVPATYDEAWDLLAPIMAGSAAGN